MKYPMQEMERLIENHIKTMERLLADWKISDDAYEKRIEEIESAWRGASSLLTDAHAENERLRALIKGMGTGYDDEVIDDALHNEKSPIRR